MSEIASRKYHFAPLERQHKAIQRLVAKRRFRNMTEFVRQAIDSYLDTLERPPLAAQAREMAEEWAQERERRAARDADRLQAPSMGSDEDW